MEGTFKPTPESVLEPGPEVLERIQSRIDKQRKIEERQMVSPGNMNGAQQQQNVQANGWSSRMRVYF